MKITDINIQPLAQEQEAWARTWAKKSPLHISTGELRALIGVLFLGSVVALYIVAGPLGAVIGSIVVAGTISALIHRLNTKKRAWQNFAKVNGWEYLSGAAKDDTNTYFPTVIPGNPILDYYEYVVRGAIEDLDCMFMSDGLTCMIITVRLPSVMPHLLLKSLRSSTMFDNRDTIEGEALEGEFSKHFTLYHHKNDQVNALSVITPDVMQVLLNNNQDQHVEIIDDKLFLVTPYSGNVNLANYTAATILLAKEIVHRANALQQVAQSAGSHAEVLYQKSWDEYDTYTKNHTGTRGVWRFYVMFALCCVLIVVVTLLLARIFPNK